MNLEEMLAHSGFVKSLSRSLVHDENTAEDVAQNTLLAAIQHPPSDNKQIRPWFARVVRNFVRILYRSEGRRKKYENDALIPEKTLSPADIAIREETLQKMTQSVFDLDEPYRTTILYRYYDGLSINDIALRMKSPSGTVKARLKRGLKMLRTRLDRCCRDHEKSWMLTLAPLAGTKLGVSTATAATGSLSLFSGAVLMSAKVKACIASLLIASAFLAVWTATSTNFNDADVISQDMLMRAGDDNVKTEDTVDQMPVAVENIEMSPDTAPIKLAVSSNGIFISGKVTDCKTGEPVKRFHFRLKEDSAQSPLISKTVYNGEGCFSFLVTFKVDKESRYNLKIISSCFRPKLLPGLYISKDEGLTNLQIELDPGYFVSGRVVYEESNEPAPGAIIVTQGYPGLGYYEFPFPKTEQCLNTETDQNGCFTLKGLNGKEQSVVALHPGYAPSWLKVDPKSANKITLRLNHGFSLFGTAYDNKGRPASGVYIFVSPEHQNNLPVQPVPIATGEDGCYRTQPLPPGCYVLTAEHDSGDDQDQVFTDECKKVVINDSDLKVNFGLDSKEYVTWRGVYYDIEGNPVSNGSLLIQEDYSHYDNPFLDQIIMKTDENGCFEVLKLNPLRYCVRSSYDLKNSGNDPIIYRKFAFETPGLVKQDIRPYKSVVTGSVINSETDQPFENMKGRVTALLEGENADKFKVDIDDKGSFSFRGLPPGEYRLSAAVDKLQSVNPVDLLVTENLPVKNIELIVHNGSLLKISGNNFNEEEWGWCNIFLEHENRIGLLIEDSFHASLDGRVEKEIFLESGKWRARLFMSGKGIVEHKFEIFPGKITNYILDTENLCFFQGTLTACGYLLLPDSSPADKVELCFQSILAPGFDRFIRRKAVPDDKGYYSIEGLKPGSWSVYITRSGKNIVYSPLKLCNLFIPEDTVDPFRRDFMLSNGTVKGSFCDGLTGGWEGLPDDDFWCVYLFDSNIMLTDGCSNDIDILEEASISKVFKIGDPKFQLENIPPGNYRIAINCDEYETYFTKPFFLKYGQDFDIGTVKLATGCILYIKVTDSERNPIKEFIDIRINGKEPYVIYHEDETIRKIKAQPGLVIIEIQKEGYRDYKTNIVLKAGKPLTVDVALEIE